MMKKIKSKAKVGIVCLLIAVASAAGFYTYASQQVKIQISQTPNVDIILTKSQTEVDLSNFEQKLKDELINQNVMSQTEINSGKLNVTAVDTQTVETQETFSWQKSVSSNIGSVSFANNGKNVSMIGNRSNPGKNAIWIIPKGSQEQHFNFGYSIDFGDSFNAAGMLLRVRKNSNGTLEGYMLSFNHSGYTFYKGSSNANGALWYFKYDGVNSNAFSVGSDIKLISALNINTLGTLDVKVTDTNITISGGGLSSKYVYTFQSGESYGEGYGFFSDHYSHGCDSIGSFALTNINLQTQTVKKFTEVLQAPEWRDGSLRILINIEDNANEQFSNTEELNAIIAKLMNNNVYYIGWGTEANREQMENAIKQNDNKGIFVGNSSKNAINETVKYIKKIIKPEVGNTIIAGEPVNIEITSPELGVETPTEAYPNGVWKVIHDENFYENPQNQYNLNGMNTNNLIEEFENVGKYYIYCEDKLVTEVYAHRRPVAAFNMNLVGNQIALTSTSYDLDIEVNSNNTAEQKANNGIKTEKWEYKKTTESKWTEITSKSIGAKIQETLDENTEYMIRLTVTDYQGVETTATKYVVTGKSTVKPIASYKIVNKTISVYEKLKVIDESYDPSGETLTYEWTVTKGNKQVYKGSTPLLDFSTKANTSYGIGSYKMSLIVYKVINGITIASEEFSQNIEVVKDITPPSITVEPIEKETQNEEISINVTMKDEESGLKSYQYAFTENINEVATENWSKEISVTGNNADKVIVLSRDYTDKILYLHVKATNQDGTVSEEKVTGPYYINPYKLELQVADSETGVGVKGAIYDISGEKQNGTLVEIAKNVTTNADGKIFVEKAKLKDVISIKIENKEKAVGYELADYKTVKIDTTNSKLVVDNTESSSDVYTQVTENGQTIHIKVLLEKIKFNLEITNIDAETKNLLSGTSFVLKKNGIVLDEKTTTEGKLTFSVAIADINTTQEYILEQSNINAQYNNIGNTYLKITFDNNGKVSNITQKLFAENSAVTISDKTNASLIVKNKRKDDSKFTVQINVKDYTSGTAIQNSKYKVKVQSANGLEYITNSYTSDVNGNIIIDTLYGTGLLKLEFIHEEAANGYVKETVNRYITINRNADGTITYNKNSIKDVFDKAETNKVYVNLTNVQKPSINAIKINIVSKVDSSIGLENIGVKIYKVLDNSLVETGTTDENGYLEFVNIKNDGKGEVLYKLEFENDVLGITPVIVIKYENYKIVDTYQMSTYTDINVFKSEDNDEEFYKYVANVNIQGIMKDAESDNELIIKQNDKETGNNILGAQYKIKMSISESISTKVVATDENGEAKAPLLQDKNLTIQITQTKAATGYLIDTKTKTIVLTKNALGIYEVKSVNNIDAIQIKIDKDGNVFVEETVSSNRYSRVNFKIAKTDENNKLSLGGFKFKVTEETTGYIQNAVTNSAGYIELAENFVATEGKSYIFKIEEIETVAPYKMLDTTINIEIRFTKEGDIVTYNGVSYLQGRDYIADSLAKYDYEQNQLIMHLTIKNTVDTTVSNILYDLDVIKVDSTGAIVEGAKYDIEIRPYAESSIISADTIVNDEIEVKNLAIKQEKTTILLKETNAAIGYGLDKEIKVVTLKIDENGNLIYLPETTTNSLVVEITNQNTNEVAKKLVTVTITEKEATEVEQPEVPEMPSNPDEQEKTNDAENRPQNATVAMKVFNKSYGNWNQTYTRKLRSSYWSKHYSRWVGYWYTSTETYQLENAQKLERIFKDNSDAQTHGFNFITGSDITLETRLVTDGVVSNKIYETSKSRGNTNVNDTNGTDSIYLYNDYKNKTVEITVIQNVPPYNYKRDTTDIKFIAKFDANGKMKSAEITQGNDTEEFAIGGVSTQGIIDNITYLSHIDGYGQKTYATGDIKAYNSLGTDTIYLGILNKALSNPLEVKVNLKDEDTNDDLDGEASVIVSEKTDDEYKPLSYQLIKIRNGRGSIKLNTTYANRTLRIEIAQIANGRNGNLKYKNDAKITTQFEISFDDDANVQKFEQITISDNVKYEGSSNNKVEYTIYNSIIYNFAINVKKLDENGKTLLGVRIQTDVYDITDISTETRTKIFTYGSKETDKNGNVKLKIILPETGTHKYYGKTMDIVLTEYYVPDNYKAIDGIKIRVLFSENGTVKDCQILSDYSEGNTTILGKNDIEPGTTEISCIDIQMQNKLVDTKPVIQITDTDSEDNTAKLKGTKYKITVWDEEQYAINNLAINETRYSKATNVEGITNIYFENAHALRTMIYKIEEVQSSNSYKKNNDILIRVRYDKDGKITTTPEILTEQYINVTGGIKQRTVKIEGNPVGNTLLKLNIINELEASFTIRINKNELLGSKVYNGNIFKATSQVKNEDNTFAEAQEERLSTEMYYNNAEIGFKTMYSNKTVLYTIFEQVGETYTERGKIEVTFDEYGNVKEQKTTGRYITKTTFTKNTKYVNTYIKVEDFNMKITVESVNKEATYSLSGYAYDIVNSKGQHSNITTKTNSLGNVIELIGEVYKGETITYNIMQVSNAIDYEPTSDIEITIVFDEDGKIVSCTPTTKQGVYDLITVVKDTTTNVNMEIKLYVNPSERASITVNVQDDANKDNIIQSAIYDVSISSNKSDIYSLIAEDGIGNLDIGSSQKYKNQTIMYTLQQSMVDDKYMMNDLPIQVSVTYDANGKITDARIIATDGYVEIDERNTIGTTELKLNTKNRPKVKMQVYNINKEDNTNEIIGSSFKIIQKLKSDLYGDTEITSSNGRAQLYVGPYYVSEKITYQITNTKAAFGFKEINSFEFTLTYDENGKIIAYELPSSVQDYVNIEIPNKRSEYYNITDIIITIKSKPLFTIGVETLDQLTNKQLVGGKYTITQTNNSKNTGTVVTTANSIAHASIGETEIGTTVTHQIVELEAPLGYKSKNLRNVIGTLQVTYDGNGKIIKERTTVLSGYNYISIKNETDKPNTFDIDLQIKYEEIEEFKVIIEAQNIMDNTDKIQSYFYGQLTTGVYKGVTTNSETGLGSINFGKVTATNSKQTLTISQSKIVGSYIAIANIKMNINFGENGQIQSISTVSGENYATLGTAYVVEQTGKYTIKITVKNNPATKFNIKNVSENEDKLINSTHQLSGTGISGSITMSTSNGEASATLNSVPKNQTVNYVLRQTSVTKGHSLNKNIIIKVSYDSNGKIKSAYQVVTSSSADRTVVKSITYDSYEINIEIKNKQKFEIYVTAQDMYNENIKLSGASIYLAEKTYSNKSVNITTNSQGEASAVLGATIANSYLDYEVDILSIPLGYDSTAKNTKYSFRVYFGSNGNIIKCSSSSSNIEVSYGNGLAVEVKVKYIPTLSMKIERTNTSTNIPLTGRELAISSSALISTVHTTTNSQGKVNINAGKINASNTVTYTISERYTATDTNIEQLPTIKINVTYDNLGKIANITTNNSNYVTAKGIGTRYLQIELGTKKTVTVAVSTFDYYNHTINISSRYEITTDKGEKFSISSTTGTTNVITQIGNVHPGEKVTFVIHQTSVQRGYETIDDQIFYVQYNADGTIKSVNSANTDRLIIKSIKQNNTKTEPNIILHLYSKSTLEVNLKVIDSIYKNGVYGLGFKVKNEETGIETTVATKTNENGILTISVPPTYENKNVNYTITQVSTNGGYKIMNPIKLVVSYGNLGTINEKGTYILNSENAKVTQGYSESLYKSSRIKGVQVEISAETEMGIGIEKVDVYGNKLNGIEYIITAKDGNNINSNRVITNMNGATTQYLGKMPKNKVVEYTISELQAPAGYRKIEDAIIKVYYDSEGRIISYTVEQQPANATIEVATDKLCTMSNSKESVHLKLKIINDNRVTFKLVNQDSGTEKPIENAEFSISVEGEKGTIKSVKLVTNSNGQASLENIQANGDLTFYFNQVKVPSNYTLSASNSGFIKINKDSKEYKLTYLSGTDGLNYTIDNETGMITVYLKNDNNLILNIIDIDGETGNRVENGSHMIKAQYGEINEKITEIISKTDNIILEKPSQNSIASLTTFNLGNTYQLFNKKVVYTISTPITPDSTSGKYNAIKEQYIAVEFDEKGFIKTVNGESARIGGTSISNNLTINVLILFENIDNYKIKVVKQAEDATNRINGAVFDINLNVEGIDVAKYTSLETGTKVISGLTIEEGIIEIRKLKYEGKTKITLTETKAPDGYEELLNIPIEVEFDVSLDEIDVDDVKLNVTNQICNSKNVKIQVNEKTREIEITIMNKSIIQLQIDKVDESENALIGMNFNLKVQEEETLSNIVEYGTYTTSDSGIIQTSIDNKYYGKSIFITLTEEKNQYFKQIAPITIKVTINLNGQISDTKIISGSENATITNTATSINIKVVNKLEEFAKPYEIKIFKINENDPSIRISNVLFQVKITPDVGIPVYKVEQTNSDGEINLKGLVGSGNISVELKEVKTPTGYQLGESEGYFKYEIKKANDLLQVVSSNLSDKLIEIDNPNKVINITVPNKTELIGLAINKVDKNDYELHIADTTFKLADALLGTEYTATTDNKGIAYFALPKGINETKEYTLVETVASGGYKLDSKIRNIRIAYDSEGKIQNVSEEDGLEIMEKNSNYVKYAVTNEQENLTILPYNIKVINVDANDNKITIENATFNVKVRQQYGATSLESTKTTNEKGEICLNVNGAGDTIISLTNTKAGNGYKINNNALNISLNRNKISGNINIKETKNVKAKYDELNNTLIIYIESEQAANQYSMQVNIVDKSTNDIITDKNVKLNITFNGETKEFTSNEMGQVIISGLQIPELEKFEISIEEIQEPTGYATILDLQKLIANVTNVYNSRVLRNVEIKQGDYIQIVSTSENSIVVNLLHEALDKSDEKLYLMSDIYRVTENYVERISEPRTVKDYLTNMKSNGEMKVYDKDGNLVSDDKYVGTGMKIIATKGEESITKTLSIIGDVTGDGLIKALDISIMKQHLVGKKKLQGAYFLSGDINDDGEIKALDISKEKQAIVGKITL